MVRARGGQVVEVRKEGDVLVAKTAPGERYHIEPQA
jgi:hypothetical protein